MRFVSGRRGRVGQLVVLGSALVVSLAVVTGSAGSSHRVADTGHVHDALFNLKAAIRDEQNAEHLERSGYHDAALENLKTSIRALESADKDLASVDLVSADAPVLSDIARAEKIDGEKDLRDGRLVQQVAIAVSLKKRAVQALEDLIGTPTPAPSANAPFTISRVKAVFEQPKFETVYTVDVTKRPFEKTLPKITARWTLKITCVDHGCGTAQGTDLKPAPNEDPGCDNAGVGVSKPFEQELAPSEGAPFIWHHPSPGVIPPYHCDHSKQGPSGHQGVITVKVTGGGWTCTAQLGGTESYDALTESIQAGEVRKATAPVCEK